MNLYYYGARYYDASVLRFTQIDPSRSKYPEWGPYVYVRDNPLRFLDPDGRDAEERERAVKKAQDYVQKNPNPDGSQYQKGAKGKPGEKVDCSGLASNSIQAAGVADPNKGNSNGVANIVQNTQPVATNNVQAGNLAVFGDGAGKANTHMGIVTRVTNDSKGNVTEFKMIHSGTRTGPTEISVTVGDPGLASRLEGFRSWDSPDRISAR